MWGVTRIDLRSDTVTLPTKAMREAMYRAELGDDVFGDDPTVNRLEELAAAKMGKEAALFVPSGTMGNLVSVITHCGRGDLAVMGDLSHTVVNEVAGGAAFGVFLRPVRNLPEGEMDLSEVEAAIPSENIHHPRPKLICIENTHNSCGGAPLTEDYTEAVGALAKRHGLALHVDGARIFNAAVALGVEARDLVQPADSVQFCLSKGLAAPVGSMICGGKDFIQEARRNRKMLGGGMRQAGVLAAAGIVAIEQMVERLQEDHDNARILAQGLAEIPGILLDPERFKTNIVYFDVDPGWMTAPQLEEALARDGVLVIAFNSRTVRVVTHYGIERQDVLDALRITRSTMDGRR